MLKPMFAIFVMLSAVWLQQPAAAPVAPAIPAEVVPAVNPIKSTFASQAQSKKMYGYDCAICHGALGNGKGELGAEQKPALKDWTDPAALKDMTDGEIFTVIKDGKGTMTGEGGRLKNDDVWNMVVLVRSFGKKQS